MEHIFGIKPSLGGASWLDCELLGPCWLSVSEFMVIIAKDLTRAGTFQASGVSPSGTPGIGPYAPSGTRLGVGFAKGNRASGASRQP